MKKKLLPLALAAAAGLTGINSAQAVHVNPDGEGEVLIYPFYTVEGGQATLISVVNTTDKTKAVKVRFLEAMNSQEVLDFNLYLSPQDHWSAAITATADGAQVQTSDTSCTVPQSLAATTPGVAGPAVAFRNFEYQSDSKNKGTDRTREGYVEIIEMAEFNDAGNAATAAMSANIKHGSNSVPANCAAVAAAWNAGGAFRAVPATLALTEPAGGLYGYGVLIDGAAGTDVTYDAVALDAFNDTVNHTDPGSLLPSLNNASPADAVVFTDGAATTLSFVDGIDAVSAAIQKSSIANDFVLASGVNAETSWVVTFPTKREYVDSTPATAPFTVPWSATNTQACEPISITYYNREEQGVAPDALDFSPTPPGAAPISLCYEANVINFNSSDVLHASDRVTRKLDVVHDTGWLTLGMTVDATNNRLAPASSAPVGTTHINGLPVIGFAAQKYVNGSVGGVLANYAGSVTHKGTVTLTP
ncbi:hypothetical protein [uncultured Pseudoteredinibacter sp.]|uniref:hypothetical protein n=1 Tax=uncultured Pseudoteredinibacter sp. TaxID=1641701 RepID=UPI00262E55D6|nr:hypothetical protein [uncultured Pseudoteredinibacter sp.]